MSESFPDFWTSVFRILDRDARYKQDAYSFVLEALDRCLRDSATPRHVSGAELLSAILAEAEHQFGPMAETVFRHWGVKNSLDFGHIVFNMVQEGILSKSETDSIDDFKDKVLFKDLSLRSS